MTLFTLSFKLNPPTLDKSEITWTFQFNKQTNKPNLNSVHYIPMNVVSHWDNADMTTGMILPVSVFPLGSRGISQGGLVPQLLKPVQEFLSLCTFLHPQNVSSWRRRPQGFPQTFPWLFSEILMH